MIATDVAGRGLDFSHVTHVINYDFPMDLESFTHRTGRTGRMGRKGKSLTFTVRNKTHLLQQIILKIGVEPIWLDRNLNLVNDAKSEFRDQQSKSKSSPQIK